MVSRVLKEKHMRSDRHFLVGAALGGVSAVAPDLVLAAFGWRHTWLPETHILVRTHRFLHSASGLLFIAFLGWASHIVIDWFSPHRKGPTC